MNFARSDGRTSGAGAVPAAATFSLDAPYSAYCRPAVAGALDAAVAEMGMRPNCGEGCVSVEVVQLNAVGGVTAREPRVLKTTVSAPGRGPESPEAAATTFGGDAPYWVRMSQFAWKYGPAPGNPIADLKEFCVFLAKRR